MKTNCFSVGSPARFQPAMPPVGIIVARKIQVVVHAAPEEAVVIKRLKAGNATKRSARRI